MIINIDNNIILISLVFILPKNKTLRKYFTHIGLCFSGSPYMTHFETGYARKKPKNLCKEPAIIA